MNTADNTASVYIGELNTSYEPLKGFENNYKIKLVDGNAKIKRIDDGYEPKYSLHNKGYYTVCLNKKNYLLHRIIAEHYIDHNDKYSVIDHVDQHRDNYKISNLRWTTTKENNKNRSGNKGVEYKFVDELPDNAVSILRYGKHWFKDYYYADNKFYYYTGVNFRILPILKLNGSEYINAKDTNNKRVNIMLNKWDKIKGF